MICRSLTVVLAVAPLLLVGPGVQAQETPTRSASQEKEKPAEKVKVYEVGKGLVFKSELSDKDARDRLREHSYAKVFLVKLEKFKEYQIDLKSTEFDCWLRVEDANSRQLAEDDDSGGKTDARIEFVPTADGVYRIIATSFGPEATGVFDLSIVER